MDSMNRWSVTALIPLALGIAAALSHNPFVYVLFFLSHFLILRFVPLFSGRESLWMFLMTALSSVPVNITLLISLSSMGGLFFPQFLPFAILRGALYYCILFAAEQTIMGIITRIIWKRQKKSLI